MTPELLLSTLDPLFDRLPLGEQLARIAAVGFDDAPGVDGYAVCLLEDGVVEVRASRGDFVAELHRVQHDLQDGSCWATTLGEERFAALEDLRPREPGTDGTGAGTHRSYADVAADSGVRSQLSARIRPRRRTLGSVTVFSRSQPVVPVDVRRLDVVGRVVAIAVEQAKVRAGIEEGLRSRTVIGQALGILMERHELGEEAALQYLRRRSSVENRKIRDLAGEIADGGPTV